ncbi:MAG: threonine--tRNA ligase [Clostridiales bacterium]|jgi:threonyl-tRNA synthetase|nr:threonine--tRNA ligase [Clostridiales bacterium]
MRITFPDGSVKIMKDGMTALEIAADLSPRLFKSTLTCELDGKNADAFLPISGDHTLKLLSWADEGGRWGYRHTASHILAQAVKRLYPETALAIGPAIENGFYYDFDRSEPFTPDDLTRIEAEMANISREDLPLSRFELTREEALAYVRDQNEPYKAELIEALPSDGVISFYKQGEFCDLCAGPHTQSTGRVKNMKLLSLAGAYWRGDEKNKMLQRIYGTAFEKKADLDEYLFRMEEAKKRDHRRLGRELDIFDIHEEGPGFPFFYPNGMIIRSQIENYWREVHLSRGYKELRTPMILNRALWIQSGHWDHYKNNMYFTQIDGEDYAVKPMNCPGAILSYKRRIYSYRDLPERFGEMGLVHRHELSGALHGLMRVRCFTQDDAHIFMTPAQINAELLGVINKCKAVYSVFNFKYRVELSTRPENSMGTKEQWDSATEALRQALTDAGLPYRVNEGDGAFYGPKIDFHLEDAIGRSWQCGTIQLDFQMPGRFDINYVGADNEKHRPVMIHTTTLGSMERFIGILIEHYAGAFPAWLAPLQVKVLTITDRADERAQDVCRALTDAGLRAEADTRNEKVGFKIREAQLQKVPYMLVIGDKEIEGGVVAVRSRKEGDIGAMKLEAFTQKLQREVAEKA